MILIVAGMLAMFNGAARAHDGDDHGAPATSIPAVRDLAQRLPDGGVFVPKSTQRILAIRTVQIEFGRASRARSNCRAASFPIRTPADLFKRRSAAAFRRRRAVFRGWGRRSRKAMSSPM